MTNYIIGHTPRFAAAVSQRNLCNRATSYGTGDMGSIFEGPFKGCYRSLMGRMQGRSSTIKTNRPDFHPPPYPSRHQRLPVQLRAGGADVHRDEGPPAGHSGAVRRLPGGKPRPHPEGNAYAQTGHLKEMADWFTKYLKAEEEAQ